MNKVFAIDGDEHLRRALASTRAGERIDLTVGGQVVARAMPAPAPHPEAIRTTMERIAEIAGRQTLAGISIKELIDEGRRP